MSLEKNIGRRLSIKRTYQAPFFIKGAVVLAVLMLLGNGVSYLIGFGQPPLVLLHEEIEYYLMPNMSYKRFGNEISINQYSMRSVQFDRDNKNPLYTVMGDSVVYGEHQIDQKQTIAYILNSQLKEKYGDDSIVVASIAASSWGPGNMLAFYEEMGSFPGKTVFLILSSHDRSDVPFMTTGRVPYKTDIPRTPLHDLVTSVNSKIMEKLKTPEIAMSYGQRHALSKGSLISLIDRLKTDYAQVALVFHATRKEVFNDGGGESYYRGVAKDNDIQFLSTVLAYRDLYNADIPVHRDNIHLTWQGNQRLSESLLQLIP